MLVILVKNSQGKRKTSGLCRKHARSSLNDQHTLCLPCPTCSCTQQGYATCGEAAVRRWRYASRATDCGAWRYNRSQAQQLLQGKWVVFAGDSVSRMLYAALLRLAGSPGGCQLARPGERGLGKLRGGH